jgi:hypothetical protein
MKKNLYILSGILLLAIIVFVILWFSRAKNEVDSVNQTDPNVSSNEIIDPVFMTETEKKLYNIPENLQAQVFNRTDTGEIATYKVIRSDEDIVTNRKQLQIRE